MNIDLDNMSLRELRDLRNKLDRAISTFEDRRKREALAAAETAAREFGFAEEDQQIVITAGVPFNIAGTTNILRVATCDERLLNRADPE